MGGSKLELRRDLLAVGAVEQGKGLPPGVVGAPSLEVSSKGWTAVWLGRSEASCQSGSDMAFSTTLAGLIPKYPIFSGRGSFRAVACS